MNAPMGQATTRYVERALCAVGTGTHAEVQFDGQQSLDGAGVLFLLPALLLQGLLKTQEVYSIKPGHYYSLTSIVLTLAFMALLRIKNPEQLKQCRPGELGRIMGLDRVPEVRCLREKLQDLTRQGKSTDLSNRLIEHWYGSDSDDASFLYIDGHNRVYYGAKANLPVKYISRQKLCLSATTEYWVNDAKGMPVMMVMGELTERLQAVIEDTIIPRLKGTILLNNTSALPQPYCTLVFDREAYQPAFFQRLWDEHGIAILTYRKNVKDTWEYKDFYSYNVQVLNNNVTMHLCEKKAQLGGYTFREVRRLGESGHQTAIITTHPSIAIETVAGRMFARWCQENFFQYLIYDYDFDKMVSFGTEAIDAGKVVVNPEYRRVNHQVKKLRGKVQRLEAKFYSVVDKALEQNLDALPALTAKQAECKELIKRCRAELNQLLGKRSETQARITIAQMPEQGRYNKLKTESKVLMNIIRMICYRAESSVAEIIAPYMARDVDEKRMLVKQIAKSKADIEPDYQNNTLTITLHSLSANRFNLAAERLAVLLTETETVFPGTNLVMKFKTTAPLICDR